MIQHTNEHSNSASAESTHIIYATSVIKTVAPALVSSATRTLFQSGKQLQTL